MATAEEIKKYFEGDLTNLANEDLMNLANEVKKTGDIKLCKRVSILLDHFTLIADSKDVAAKAEKASYDLYVYCKKLHCLN